MFCSTIIPTIGRPSLNRAVESVLSQGFVEEDGFEIIVVNDSGSVLSDADWQHSDRVTIIETFQRERSIARNVGASVARGKYLHFLDDDDWLAPNALLSFWELAGVCDAGWLYGTSQLVDRQHKPLIQLTHGLSGNVFLPTMAGEWIPLQASVIKSDVFFEVGGFNPLLVGPEDIDLLRRVALHDNIAETPDLVAYVVMGKMGSTTDYNAHPLASRWAREKILDAPEAFFRLRDKATICNWRGRFSRIYLTSTIWNLRNKRMLMALSRAFSSLRTLFIARSSLLSTSFWDALTRSYQSETFARGHDKVRSLAGSTQSQSLQDNSEASNESWNYS